MKTYRISVLTGHSADDSVHFGSLTPRDDPVGPCLSSDPTAGAILIAFNSHYANNHIALCGRASFQVHFSLIGCCAGFLAGGNRRVDVITSLWRPPDAGQRWVGKRVGIRLCRRSCCVREFVGVLL